MRIKFINLKKNLENYFYKYILPVEEHVTQLFEPKPLQLKQLWSQFLQVPESSKNLSKQTHVFPTNVLLSDVLQEEQLEKSPAKPINQWVKFLKVRLLNK
jgi:hypothetical protein